MNFRQSGMTLDVEHSLEHDGVLIELRRLARLTPTAGASHVRDGEIARPGIHPPHVLVDLLRRLTGSFDPGGS